MRYSASELLAVLLNMKIILKLVCVSRDIITRLQMFGWLTQSWMLSSARAKVVNAQAARNSLNNNRKGRSWFSSDWPSSFMILINCSMKS
jgi:hypothetical protein